MILMRLINQSKRIKDYAKLLGVSSDMFSKMWSDDSAKTLEKVVKAMEKVDDTSENASIILKDLKLSGVRQAETLLKLSGHGDDVRDAIKMSSEAWVRNSALQEKSNVIYETTAKK